MGLLVFRGRPQLRADWGFDHLTFGVDMTTHISTTGACVDQDYFWRPMATCPRAAKVQLLNPGGVAVYSSFNGTDTTWQGWAPLPKRPPEKNK